MNKRQRKKWLKKHGQYVAYSELWNLSDTICDWIIPRLKAYKQENMGHPMVPPVNSEEKWNEALDQMIRSFELAKLDPDFLDEDLKPCSGHSFDAERNKYIYNKWQTEMEAGLMLFAKWFTALWL